MRMRAFFKKYFACALGCSFPIIESVIVAISHTLFFR
jgi:hypothetical protein